MKKTGLKASRTLTAWILTEAAAKNAPKAFAATWRAAAKRFALKGKAGEQCLVLDGPAPSLLLGAGSTDVVQPADRHRAVHEAAVRAVDFARRQKYDSLALGGVPDGSLEAAVRGLHAGLYSFKIGGKKPAKLETRIVGADPKKVAAAGILAESVAWARDRVNTPPGEKFPARIVETIAADIRKRARGVRVEIWDEKRLRREECRGVLAVGQGSVNPPRVMRLTYAPAGAKRHACLVGKGVTFDAGGLNIKTFEGMKTMKCDMAGSAAVVAAVIAAARLRLKVRITALVGFAENMLGGRAFKPGDVVTQRSGKTVEILNTDAEGRIILADLLDIAAGVRADCVVDLATLTGACLAALGEETAGLFTTDGELGLTLSEAAAQAGEPVWRLPMGRDFREKLKGDVSDLKNIGGRYGGASSAAQFLSEFAGNACWAHLDIAGPAFRESNGGGRPTGATGFGVATLVELLRRMQ
jgi:leucyl aminopeptidase